MKQKTREKHWVPSGQWELEVERFADPERFEPSKRPVLMVPGFGMNAFILTYHPLGCSMVSSLTSAGYEVWTVNMRGQGGARARSSFAGPSTLEAYVAEDLPSAIGFVLKETQTNAQKVNLIGSSLGGSLVYAYLAMEGDQKVGAVVAIGAPLTWLEVHPLVKLLSIRPRLARHFDLRGKEAIARKLLPFFARSPLFSIYINTEHIDVALAPKLLETLTFPDPALTVDLACWVRRRRLEVAGRDVATRLKEISIPLLVVLANRDGLVPFASGASVRESWGGALKILEVGTSRDWYSHADIFVSFDAPQLVFRPLTCWLEDHEKNG